MMEQNMKGTGADMDAIALVSGGKDSLYATYIAMQQGLWIKRIVNIIPEKFSYMYHFPNIHLVKLISESMEIPFMQFKISDDPEELKNVLNNFDEKVIISGAIESDYQKTRLEKICTDLGKIHFSPLWRKNPWMLLNEIINSNFKVIFVSVSAEGLNDEFLGSELNYDSLGKLKILNKKYGIHPSGEGGEYETLVLDAPIFKKRIKILDFEKIWEGNYGILNIKNAILENKEIFL